MGMADDELAKALMGVPPAQSFEGAEQRGFPNGLWGPKTSTEDAPYYLPEALIGELPYRYQGVALHSALAAMPLGWLNALFNGGYSLATMAAGRTGPVKRAEDQLPMPQYPPTLAGYLRKDYQK